MQQSPCYIWLSADGHPNNKTTSSKCWISRTKATEWGRQQMNLGDSVWRRHSSGLSVTITSCHCHLSAAVPCASLVWGGLLNHPLSLPLVWGYFTGLLLNLLATVLKCPSMLKQNKTYSFILDLYQYGPVVDGQLYGYILSLIHF